MRALALLLAATLTALPLITSCTADPSPAPDAATRTDRDSCLIGTWQVDVTDMAKQAAAQINSGATGTGSGTVTLLFGDQMAIKYDTVIDMSGKINGQPTLLKSTITGNASSTDWVAKNGNLSGTMSANAVTAKTTGTIGGTAVPVTTTPFDGALDLAPGAVGYTCSASTASLTTPTLTWHLTKA